MEASGSAAAAPQLTWPDIAIVNDASSGMADDEVKPIVDALARQVLYDFGPRWHIGAHLHFVGAGAKPPAGAWVLAILDTSDQAGALGYHDLTPDGMPLGKVFAGTDRQYGEQVSVTLSHELLEMLGDPWIALAAQADDGKFYAWETCDAVEADALGYQVDGVQMSAFVTPAWFGHGSGAVAFPEKSISQAFELAPGGYISVFDPAAGQGWTQIDGEHSNELVLPGQLSPARSEWHVDASEAAKVIRAVPRIGSRRERRFRGRMQWVLSTYDQE